MSEIKYWQNFGELNNSEESRKASNDEFREELPFDELADENVFNAKTPRRDFLKYMGFSTAAAAIAASCEMPVHKAIPFLHKPDDMLPGVANYYASTYVSEGDAVPVVVKQREGRPIKIEGNQLSSLTAGGTSAQVQASVLDLYDTSRLRYPMADKKEATFEAIDKMIAQGLSSAAGKPIVLLTSTINSVTGLKAIGEFLERYPGSRHVQYDAVSYSGLLTANEQSYGMRAIPSYRFDKAKVIVSLGADFLGTWLSPVVFANQYAANRRINENNPVMSRHIQFESHFSMTGASADERYLHKPSQTASIALALLGALGGGTSANLTGLLAEQVKKTAAELSANKGAALVVCGSNDPDIQMIVNAINEAIGANGTTINRNNPVNYRKGIDADMAALTNDLHSGAIGGLVVYQANPVYNYFDSQRFAEGLKKVPFSLSLSAKMDETTELCKYVVPSHHWLESWGDAELQTGYVSVVQPLIHPLFKTRQFEESILRLAGNNTPFAEYFQNHWTGALGSMDNYYKFLQDGVLENNGVPAASRGSALFGMESTSNTGNLYQPASFPTGTAFAAGASMDTTAAGSFSGNVAEAAGRLGTVKGGDVEVVLYESVAIGNGCHANNAWLQEMSDPITKATWDNYIMVSPEMGKKLFNIDIFNPRQMDKYDVHPEKPVAKLTVNNKSLELPILIIPGTHPEVVAVALGYGRQSTAKDKTKEYIGPVANGVGQNAYVFATSTGRGISYTAPATIEKTGKTYRVAQSQTHHLTDGRPIIRETNLKSFVADPAALGREEREELAGYGENFTRDATMYPTFEKPGIKWGMSIDLNTCIGCNACAIACVAENNIPVVGKNEVALFHDMQWLRIDRYFTGDPQNPDIVFQPMLCQHCDNAPCENVCPVSATNHSSEGLNQMIYNRCIGTRYCANNCPYKVRRFNWADYTGADSFPDNQRQVLSDATMDWNDDLTRMVLNPDVTVRARGTMEKCTFCVQRLQDGKLHAKKENRPLKDGEVQTACSQACPTNAIVFGNVNDPESHISRLRQKDQVNRKFYVLEQLHTLSNVNYLAKVRNTERTGATEKV